MELTPAQARTVELLFGRGAPPEHRPDLVDHIRSGAEDGLEAEGVLPGGGPAIWLGKHRLNDRARCEGFFLARLSPDRPPFEHSARTAAGAVLHGAIEVDTATDRGLDPRSACQRGAERLAARDGSFAGYWGRLDGVDRAHLVTDAGRHLGLFRDSFPPLLRAWAPQPELYLRASLAGGRVVLSGAPDLVLGRGRRLVIDFKTGGARSEHPEDMRFYALLLLLRTGLAPYRVATVFLDSGEWQAEDVTESTLRRAVERVVAAAASAHRVQSGALPALTPGVHCGWCPASSTCPALLLRAGEPTRAAAATSSFPPPSLEGSPNS
jgi:PD-(D/E)XK nuclease superfamily